MFLRNDNSRGGVHSLVAKGRVAGVSLMGRTLTYTLHLPVVWGKTVVRLKCIMSRKVLKYAWCIISAQY